VIVPREEDKAVASAAASLGMPYFSIIEVPVQKYLLVKKQQFEHQLKPKPVTLRSNIST
jgi:cysteine sulfinate desulfinase/cysteine desulfurase-like protein